MRKHELTIEDAVTLGLEYKLNGALSIRQPTLGEVIEYGEAAYYNLVGYLTCIPSDCKAALDDIGLDWCKLSDFEMFVLSTRALTPDDTYLLFGESLDLSRLEVFANNKGEMELRDPNSGIVINDSVRAKISEYLCRAHGIVKKPEFPANEMARYMLLEESKEAARESAKAQHQNMLPRLISFVANIHGSKYDYDSCLKLRFSTFMDSVQRLQVIENATALRNACYSGMIDTKKIDKNDMDMLRDLSIRKQQNVVKGA